MKIIVDQLDRREWLIQALGYQRPDDLVVYKRVSKIVSGNESFVVKEFFQPYGWWRLFVPNKGVRVWNMHKLAKGKVDVCQPVMLFYEEREKYIYSGVVFQDEGISLNFIGKGHVYKEELEFLEKKMEKGGILHGDIKPSNLLVTKDGSLKLIDLDGMSMFPRGSILFHNMHKRDKNLLLQLAANFGRSNRESGGDVEGVFRSQQGDF